MHILILTQYFPPEIGASQARLDFYAHYFAKMGNRVTVVTTFPNYPSGVVRDGYRNACILREKTPELEIVRTWFWEDGCKSGKARLKWYVSFMFSSLIGAIRTDKPDIIIVENPPLFVGITASILRFLWNVPVINHVSDMWVDAAVNFGFIKSKWQLHIARRIERFVLTHCDGIISVTEKVHAHALKFQNSSRVHLISNGVDADLYLKKSPDSDLLKSLGLEGNFIVTYAGTMGFQHGLDVIIEAAEIIQQRFNSIKLIFIGDGSEKERIQRIVYLRNISNVIFIEPQTQKRLVDYLNISAVGISTLKHADFTSGILPVKIFSYMACELPVIATDIGESGLLVKKAGCGITVPPEDPRAIADTIMRLYSNRALIAEFGRKGREFVEAHFSRKKSAQSLLELMVRTVSLS